MMTNIPENRHFKYMALETSHPVRFLGRYAKLVCEAIKERKINVLSRPNIVRWCPAYKLRF